MRFVATGFFYGFPRDVDSTGQAKSHNIFLVTNRHVIEGQKELTVRVNRRENEPAKLFLSPLKTSDGSDTWIKHPGDADVAITHIDAPNLAEQGVKFDFFRDPIHTVSRKKANELGISEGVGVYVLGFPLGLAGKERNYAIARHGVIARVQDWLRGDSNEFLIDATVFPGNSGGPVVTKPELANITGTKPLHECSLIGLVSSYIPYQDMAVSTQSGMTRAVFQENSGLAVVVPFDAIREAVGYWFELNREQLGDEYKGPSLPIN
ncbi:MAG: serine protease [Chloroflexota bacterium]|nr:serine protease [Chloroflexota bacterium]